MNRVGKAKGPEDFFRKTLLPMKNDSTNVTKSIPPSGKEWTFFYKKTKDSERFSVSEKKSQTHHYHQRAYYNEVKN